MSDPKSSNVPDFFQPLYREKYIYIILQNIIVYTINIILTQYGCIFLSKIIIEKKRGTTEQHLKNSVKSTLTAFHIWFQICF